MAKPIKTLCIVSHVVHYRHNGGLYAYAPYAREIEMWADIFPRIVIASPLRNEQPPADTMRFTRDNIAMAPQPETGGDAVAQKLAQLLLLPWLIWKLSAAMFKADAVHVRCPGNLGLLGALLAPLFSRYRVAKYAGQWGHFPNEARTVTLQRAVLGSRWWNAPVLVYGQWPNQPAHVIPFFTSVLTAEQMEMAQTAAARKQSRVNSSLHILFVGRLSKAKNVDAVLRAFAKLPNDNASSRLSIAGEGPEKETLHALARELRISERVHFLGGVDFDEVLKLYEQADVLVLVSETEGWPKAITEAMAFGLICIGAKRGLVPQILGEGRGLVIEAGDENALAQALLRIQQAPQNFLPMRSLAAQWSKDYSLEGLRDAIAKLLSQQWQQPLAVATRQSLPS